MPQKKFVVVTLFIIFGALGSNAQTALKGWDRLLQIELLRSDRFDVDRILSDFKSGKLDREDHAQKFWNEEVVAIVFYAPGSCSDQGEIWSVPEWKVTSIEILPRKPITPRHVGLDLSRFKKERAYINVPKSFLYHSRKLGLALETDEDEIERIWVFPKDAGEVAFCKTKSAKSLSPNGRLATPS